MTDTLRHSVIFPGLEDKALPWDKVRVSVVIPLRERSCRNVGQSPAAADTEASPRTSSPHRKSRRLFENGPDAVD